MKCKTLYGAIVFSLCALSVNSYARIKLITLPVREHVEIQLENEHTTIIEEERVVPLKQGLNDIDFSWHNTSIRPETIVLRMLVDNNSAIKTNVLSISYPPNESALTWKVAASQNGSARVRITYAINRLDKNYHYLARVSHDEKTMNLSQFIKVSNQSGEEYLNAQMNTGGDKPFALPMGLDETQEFLNHRYDNVPIEKTYTINPAELGYRDRAQDKLNVFMHYYIQNDKKHQLGKHSLKPGKFRIYQLDKNGSSVFIGEDWGQYTAKDDEQKLFIGQAQDIVVKRTIKENTRHRINGNLYNIDAVVKYDIQNFKDSPVTLTIEESIPHLRNEVFNSRQPSHTGNSIEWQIGNKTTFSEEPVKKLTSSDKIAYQITLPARTGTEDVTKLEQQLNINFKNEW